MAQRIGDMNGMWGLLLRVQLAVLPFLIGLMSWLVVNQVLDNEFRDEGPRFSKDQAITLSEVIVLEVKRYVDIALSDHAAKVGHDVMHVRVTEIERRLLQTMEVEREETEILRVLQQDISNYIKNLSQ